MELKELTTYIDRLVREGFRPDDEILEIALEEAAADFEHCDDDGLIRETVRKASKRHAAREARWKLPTDPDKLTRAFDVLEKSGIYSRENYWCCQSCAMHAIFGEMTSVRSNYSPVRGYVFYHEQDTSTALAHGDLFLAFGANEEHSSETIALEIIAALQKEGFCVSWDGSSETRIRITKIRWRKRRRNIKEVIRQRAMKEMLDRLTDETLH